VSGTKNFQSAKLLVITAISVCFLLSCSTSKKVTKQAQTKEIAVKDISGQQQLSAEQLLNKAENSTVSDAPKLLIQASQQFIEQNSYSKALWLANQALPLTTQVQQRYQIAMIKAQVLHLMNEPSLAIKELKQAKAISANNKLSHQKKYFQLLADVQTIRGLAIASIEARLHAFSFIEHGSEEQNDQSVIIWKELEVLSQWQIQQLIKRAPPRIKGWQQLLSFAHRFGFQQTTFNRYLTQWQRSFPDHPANLVVEQLKVTTLAEDSLITNIAVILPLSGKQQAAGQSAQQGVLAAYNNNLKQKLHFIDSQSLDMSTLHVKFEELEIDHVIGPLLKPKVQEYLSQNTLTLPTLLLNLPNKTQLATHQIALSMRPEDQGVQAATTLSQRSYKQPIIFSHRDNVSKRIAQTFSKQWLKITGNKPGLFYFESGAAMQKQLKDSFDVSTSENRIQDLKRRIKQTIKTETRNRRDIDMIYLVGSTKATRLLKPYIDVNTSQFAEIIPIYASSRSHSDNSDKSDSRDLTGLVFTEMPWLLPSKQQNSQLKQLNKSLWPEKSDGLQRIFAMGFDSLSLIEKQQAMQQHPYVRHYGQTGVLKLNADNILTRSLLWGSYQKDQVIEVAMD